MILRILEKKEVEDFYNNYMTKDFPDPELKPLDSILKMNERDCYEPLGVFDEEGVLGYAFMTKIPGENYLLLDYLAVNAQKRHMGNGKKILAALRERYKNKIIFIESENPDFLDGKEKEIAKKRLLFYENNGVLDTGILSCIWTVHYINFYLSDSVCERAFCKKALEKIYEIMMPSEDMRSKYVEID